MSVDFSKATSAERERFAALLDKHDAQTCKACGAAILIEGCCSSGNCNESGTWFSVITVACNSCGADAVVANSWYPDGHDDVDTFLSDLEEEWPNESD